MNLRGPGPHQDRPGFARSQKDDLVTRLSQRRHGTAQQQHVSQGAGTND